MNWPASLTYTRRFRVADLVPEAQALRAVFIGESPHRDEVAPISPGERSPFRGVAGRDWWTELAKYLKKPIVARPVPPRADLLGVCGELRIAVMNAIQFPLDSKICLHQGDASNPSKMLGFEKATGPHGYKAAYKRGDRAVTSAILDLAARLSDLPSHHGPIVCLGNDSRWFVERAVDLRGREEMILTIPHPSSWWRNAQYKIRALDVLRELLGDGISAKVESFPLRSPTFLDPKTRPIRC